MKKLHSLEVGEVSFVPEGANKRKFLIFKSQGGSMPHPHSALQKLISSTSPEVMKNVDDVMAKHLPQANGQPAPKQPAPGAPAPHPAAAPGAQPHSPPPQVQQQPPAPAASPGAQTPVPTAKTEQPGIAPEEIEQAKHALKAIVRIVSPWKDKLSPIMLHEVLDAAGFMIEAGPADGDLDPDADGDVDLDDDAEGADGTEPADKSKKDDEEEDDDLEDKVNKDDGAMNLGDGHPTHDANAKDKDMATKVGKDHKATPEKVLSTEKDVLKGFGIKDEDMEEAKKAAHGAYKAHMEKLGHRMYPDAEIQMKSVHKSKEEGGDTVEKIAKSADGTLDLSGVPEAARPVVEAIYKGQQEAVRKAAELEDKLKQRDLADQKRELVQKAAGYTHLGLKQDEIVASLEDAAKAGPEALVRITKQYETLNAQAKSSKLFQEFGSSLPAHGKGDAEAKIDAAVEQIVAKSTGVTSAQAYEQFIKTQEGQALYAEYKSTRKDGI